MLSIRISMNSRIVLLGMTMHTRIVMPIMCIIGSMLLSSSRIVCPLRIILGNSLRRLKSHTVSRVLLHLRVETKFVLLCLILVLLFLIGGKTTPTFSEDGSHLDKLDSGELLHYLGTMFEGEEYERSAGSLGLFGILLLFEVLFVNATILNEVSRGIVSRRRDVGGHFRFVTSLVLSGVGFPTSLLLVALGFVHVGGVLCELTKGDAGVVVLEKVERRRVVRVCQIRCKRRRDQPQ
jgi:hypothetical protein